MDAEIFDTVLADWEAVIRKYYAPEIETKEIEILKEKGKLTIIHHPKGERS
jgi:hypothetical protein